MKNKVRLTESQLYNVIRESVKQVINEIGNTSNGQRVLGQVTARQAERGNYGDAEETAHYATKNNTQDNSNDFDAGQREYKKNHPLESLRLLCTYFFSDFDDSDDLAEELYEKLGNEMCGEIVERFGFNTEDY